MNRRSGRNEGIAQLQGVAAVELPKILTSSHANCGVNRHTGHNGKPRCHKLTFRLARSMPDFSRTDG